MVLLKSCCGCSTLKTGTIITGYAGIILASISILVLLLVQGVEFKTIIIDALPQWAVKLILIINLVMTILISILLIVGAMKRNMFFMLPWVVLGIMLAIGLLISVIYTAVKFYINNDTFNGTLWLVFGIVSVVVYVYFWAVVYSFFQTIREENDRGAYQKQPFKRYPNA